MRSPHEFAALMLVKDTPDQIELDRAEVGTLLARQLIALERLVSGGQRPCLARDGGSVLEACSRIR
jgi:hypothetical protein